jgi:secreted trypsin-like serine protease
VGGTADTADPAVVGIAVNGRAGCTGTLIAPQTVITAAHCFQGVGSQTPVAVWFAPASATGGLGAAITIILTVAVSDRS